MNFVTIATTGCAAQSRIFARSARECHPDARLVVVVPDAAVPPPGFADLYDLVLLAEDLSLDGLADMRFRYSLDELCLALRPWAIRHLLDRYAGDAIYYFDSDIELFTPLAEAEAALAQGANLVLVPQILQPGADQGGDRALLRSGLFNAGFVAVAPRAPARAFVAWWCERVRTGCTRDPLDEAYGGGNWLALAPSICDDVAILRHPGYNFSYRNAGERPLSCLGGAWSAAGCPLRFVHYNQWNLQEQDAEQYLARYFPAQCQPITDLFEEYRRKVQDEGSCCGERAHGDADQWRAPSGETVPEVVRSAYARHAPAVDGDLTAVFARAVAVLDAPSKTRSGLLDPPVSVLYDEIWQHHGNLRYRFDIERESGRLAYLRWLVDQGAAELGIPAIFLEQARSAVNRQRLRKLESDDEPIEISPPTSADPDVLQTPAAVDAVAGLLAAHDAERDRMRRLQDDIRLLVGSNKSLRREVLSLRVRRWRDEETIRALEKELAESRDALTRHSPKRTRFGSPFVDWLHGQRRRSPAEADRREILEGDGPFFKRGFHVGETAAIVGATVRRIKSAPSGTMIFGPYINLPAGRYAATIDARLYQRLPLVTNFKVDVVCDGAQRVVGGRRFHLHSFARRRRFELVFTVLAGEASSDFEIRIWARRQTPLEVSRIAIYQLPEKTGTVLAA